MKKKLIIAIDGYSSCGKSTFAKQIARELDYIYIDSGAMYRAVTLYCIRRNLVGSGVIIEDTIINELKDIHIEFVYNPDMAEYETYLNSENVEREIRGLDVSAHVSRISQIPEVRSRMVELQRQIGVFKGIVMDGRDIGTVVFPDADNNITARDITDENRDISPLRRADDAVVLDNSRMTVGEQMDWVRRIIEQKRDGSRD